MKKEKEGSPISLDPKEVKKEGRTICLGRKELRKKERKPY
jgi:hypothetical protein